MFKYFFKNYKLSFICFLISSVIVILYIVAYDWPELFAHGGLYFNVVYNLSLAVIANFIFTFFQIFLPNYKSDKKRHEYVINKLIDIKNEMHNFFYKIVDDLNDKKNFDENDFKKLYRISMLNELKFGSLYSGKFQKRKLMNGLLWKLKKLNGI